jgi:hypothetical protein
MKFRFIILLGIVSIIAVNAQKRAYFTPEDQKNWIFVLNKPAINAGDLFIFDNGILKITDVTTGYLRTKKVYRHFVLEIDWRWPKVAANSGILIHIQKNDTVWPACYQVQQKANAAGDIICMKGLRAKECTDSVKFTIPKLQASNEKAPGEWNHIKVVSKKGTLEVYVNGVLQNKITGMTAKKGYIGLQAEGKPVEFKNLTIR